MDGSPSNFSTDVESDGQLVGKLQQFALSTLVTPGMKKDRLMCATRIPKHVLAVDL